MITELIPFFSLSRNSRSEVPFKIKQTFEAHFLHQDPWYSTAHKEALQKRWFMQHDPNVTRELRLTSEYPGLDHQECPSTGRFGSGDLSKGLKQILFLLFHSIFSHCSSYCSNRSWRDSFDTNALKVPLNCDCTKFACLPSAYKSLVFAPVKLTCWTYSL